MLNINDNGCKISLRDLIIIILVVLFILGLFYLIEMLIGMLIGM